MRGIQVSFKCKYICPIGANTTFRSLWDPVVDKCERRLSSGKKYYLSLGGRITLIIACLSNLPVYYMSLFEMPKTVVGRLYRIRMNFLWEGQGDKKKLHLLRRNEVIKPRWCVGLGLGDLEKKNGALLAKWWWRYGEGSSL